MEKILKFNKKIGKIEEFILSFSIISLTLLLLVNVIARKIFLNSLTFAEELAQFFLIVITFLGIGYTVKKNQHINMTAFIDIASFKIKKILIMSISIISVILMLIFAFYGFKYLVFVFNKGRVTPALEIPRWIYTLSIPIGFLLGAIQYIINIYLNFKNKDRIYMGNSMYYEEVNGEKREVYFEEDDKIMNKEIKVKKNSEESDYK